MRKYELFSSGLEETSLAGSCEEFHEFLGSIRKGKFFEYLRKF